MTFVGFFLLKQKGDNIFFHVCKLVPYSFKAHTPAEAMHPGTTAVTEKKQVGLEVDFVLENPCEKMSSVSHTSSYQNPRRSQDTGSSLVFLWLPSSHLCRRRCFLL